MRRAHRGDEPGRPADLLGCVHLSARRGRHAADVDDVGAVRNGLQPGRYRPIEITALKKDLQVRSRKGYYAPRQ